MSTTRYAAYRTVRRTLQNERTMRERVFAGQAKALVRAHKVGEIDRALEALDNLAEAAGVETERRRQEFQSSLFEMPNP